MGEGFSGENAMWTIYLVVYLLAVVGWLRRDRKAVLARRAPPRCEACDTQVPRDAAEGIWGGWTCANCGESVAHAPPSAVESGFKGWLARHPWAAAGALWATIAWVVLAVGGWWLHESGPSLKSLPLATLGGFAAGWLLQVTVGRD